MSYLQKISGGKNRKWRAFINLKGHPSQSKTFRLKSEASDWAKELETALLSGTYKEPLKMTVDDLIDKYKLDVLSYRKNNGGNQIYLINWWSSQIGDLKLVDVTHNVLDNIRINMRKSKNKRGVIHSPSNVNKYFTLISAVFNKAIDWELITVSPMRRIKTLKTGNSRTRFLSKQEVNDLLKACKESKQSKLYEVVLFALTTGARRGEIMGLMWEDVDFESSRFCFKETKNGSDRFVPIATEIRELLLAREQESGLLYPPLKSVQFCVRRSFKTALNRANIKDFKFHDLRHTAASYLAMSGASLLDIAEILGHKNISQTRRYAHLTNTHLQEAVDKLGRIMDLS
ncbi:MAG: integrase [Candidatus Cloacimonadota bacterium]|nr:MAG: integrase [Candidatus Cloacimonadota bacterium]